MTQTTPLPKTVAQWLTYIEKLHPKSIEMGLDRVKAVVENLNISPEFNIISIAGTNGKGSTCALLERIYSNAGYLVGAYTSPHFIAYNERIKVNCTAISDDDLCRAFSAVEQARGEIVLTYFEMGTLAAIWHFQQSGVDVAILEVGMGGRLDAVNVFDADCSIVTCVDIDHTAYLGETREEIGYEKAGIFRSGKPAICGDDQPPNTLTDFAEKTGAKLSLIHHQFQVEASEDSWQYRDDERRLSLPPLALEGDFQMNNAGCAIRAVLTMQALLPVKMEHVFEAIAQVRLIGRYYQWQENPTILLDVAHNPQAARSLANNLAEHACEGQTLAVAAMLADKDIKNVLMQLVPQVSGWYLADSNHDRGAKAEQLRDSLKEQVEVLPVQCFNNIQKALESACIDCGKNDRIVVFGSFYTVADALAVLQT